MSDAFLRVEGLTKSYGGVLVVDDVCFDVHPGEIVGLVGKNGAGKSTVIKMIGGAVAPDAGRLLVGGKEAAITTPHAAQGYGIAIMHQELETFPGLSVAENMLLGSRLPRRLRFFVDWPAVYRTARELASTLGEPLNEKAPIEAASPAQSRLALIGRALHARAQLLVLDEPTASLTDREIEQLHAICRRVREQGGSIVYVSHRLNEILGLSDRVLVMRDGRIVHDGPTNALDHGHLVEAITGVAAGVGPEPTVAVAKADRGEPILSVRHITRPGSVHDVSFDLHAGEVLGIAGLVGAGRTELARLVFGAERATEGTIEVRGRKTSIARPRDAMRAGIALLPEDRRHEGLIMDFNIRENITLASLRRLSSKVPLFPSRARERDDARALFARLDIVATGIEQGVRLLSGGNQQKVVVGKWLERGADIMFFDEPTAGIDVRAKEQIYSLVRELADSGKGIVFISSDFAELVGVCDRVLVMREHSIVGELVGEEITERAMLGLCYQSTAA